MQNTKSHFGGKTKKMVGNKKCFNLNGQENPEIHTIEEVRKVYRNQTPKINLFRPTLLSFVLKELILVFNQEYNYKKYHIMMILTDDGKIDNMKLFQLYIRWLLEIPMSIIIRARY